METGKGRQLDLATAAALIRPRDTVTTGFVSGQAVGILHALGERDDLEDVALVGGILVQPYPFLQKRGVRVVSAFFGPIERLGRSMGARVEFLAVDFHGLERLMLRERPRVVLAVASPPDADGWLSFGTYAGATYRPFVEAARDPARLAIAEVNPRMPRVAGLPEHGGHRIHVSEVDAWVEYPNELVTLPAEPLAPEAVAIAERAVGLIEHGATLQFGIGAVPDEVARLLAAGPLGDFGVHSEMISDGLMALHRAGKVSNADKGLYDGVSSGTFAFGSGELYAWLDRNPEVGGAEAFVQGASEAPGGKSLLCLASTTEVDGRRISTIVPRLGTDMCVTTPRHHVQWVITEHGSADLSTMTDVERARALIALAHPDFREELARSAGFGQTPAP
jgi:acyl-CoA hydrolase